MAAKGPLSFGAHGRLLWGINGFRLGDFFGGVPFLLGGGELTNLGVTPTFKSIPTKGYLDPKKLKRSKHSSFHHQPSRDPQWTFMAQLVAPK